ncbi:NACHT domain-containing protein [Streptomyces sp. NPDC047000]|uniref:NACHT domain-containing protein n=1 Tax=Streptomyces sp. NPDC047000 TaxID=3155474 RepID=UPI003409A6D1
MSRPRRLLVVASQCRTMHHLDGLSDTARDLATVLLDSRIGGCLPALADGPLLRAADGTGFIPSAEIVEAVRRTAREAAQEGATLVLALLGHGFIPGNARTLYFMGADAVDQDRGSAVDVGELLLAADAPGMGGVVALIDTCSAGSALPPVNELLAGRRGGEAGLAVLASSGPDDPSYDLAFTRELCEVLSAGTPGAAERLSVGDLETALRERLEGQVPKANSLGGGMSDRLWVAHNQALAPRPVHAGAGPRGAVSRAPVPRPADVPYRTLCDRYLGWAEEAWRFIDLGALGAEQGRASGRPPVQRLPLERMYISLQADPRTLTDRQLNERLRRQDEADEAPPVARHISQREIIRQIIDSRESDREEDPGPPAGRGPQEGQRDHSAQRGRADARTPSPGVALETAFARHRLLVLLGGAGSGKSVTCQWLGTTLAREGLEVLYGERPGPLRIPLRFRVAQYAQYYENEFASGDEPGSLAEFLAWSLSEEDLDGVPVRYQAMIQRALDDRQAVLLIDGLDELIHHREEVIGSLAGLVTDYVVADATGTSRAVITSRVDGYDSVHLTLEDVAHYLIRPMSPEQVEHFTESFFTAIGEPGQTGPFLARLAADRPVVRRLAANPLRLTSLCSTWHRWHELPAGLAPLCRRLILDTAYLWRGFGDDSADPALGRVLADEDFFLWMLAHVAEYVQEDKPDGQVSRTQLLRLLDEAFYGSGLLTADSVGTTARVLANRIREKVGVLAEVSHQQFRFNHATFREYLAGYSLLTTAPSASAGPGVRVRCSGTELLRRFQERLVDPRWRQPLVLALGECTPEERAALVEGALDAGPEQLPEWADVLLTAALDRSSDIADRDELALLLHLVARASNGLRRRPDLLAGLDDSLAELRRNVGTNRFDDLAMELCAQRWTLTGPLTDLYRRHGWITRPVLETFVRLARHDDPAWGLPVQRVLRRAGTGTPQRTVTFVAELKHPEGDDKETQYFQRLHELGQRAWERQVRQTAEEEYAEIPVGALPLRELFMDDGDLWSEVVTDPGCARVLAGLFGGLDHHEALRWADEWDDFARLLSLPDPARADEIEARAAELVPRFGVDETVYQIAVLLDTVGGRVTLSKPAPALEPRWLTRPSLPAVRDAVRNWAMRTPGDRARLRAALEAVATGPGIDHDERAEAELGLLVLDGRPMSVDRRSVNALERALEATGDAALRSSAAWFRWVGQGPLSEAERPVAYRFLLRTFFSLAGHPVPLPGSNTEQTAHPVGRADALARRVLARSWGAEETDLPDLSAMPASQLLTVLGWLSTLPYLGRASPYSGAVPQFLWHDAVPDTPVRRRALLGSALRDIVHWVRQGAPGVEPELSTALAGDREPWREPSAQEAAAPGPEEPSGPMAVWWRFLADHRRQTVGGTGPEELARLAAQPVSGYGIEEVLLLVALSERAPDQAAALQSAALTALAGEPDQSVRAEVLRRCRPRLVEDPAVRERFDALVAELDSPLLRADARDDLAACAEALAAMTPATAPDPGQWHPSTAAHTALLTACHLLRELGRLGAPDLPDTFPSSYEQSRHSSAWSLRLDLPLLDSLRRRLAEDPGRADEVAKELSLVTDVDADAVPELAAWAASAGEPARWAASAQDLAVLRPLTRGSGTEELRHLARLALTGDAGASARARLELLGPVRQVEHPSRHHVLSDLGVDLWWKMGRAAVTEPGRQSRLLFSRALNWDIDDADAVHEVLRRSRNEEYGRETRAALLQPGPLWRADAQLALAAALDASTTADPEPDAEWVSRTFVLVCSTLANGTPEPVLPELLDAVLRACARTGLQARFLPDMAEGELRLGVAEAVVRCCAAALGRQDEPDAPDGEPAAAEVGRARALFHRLTDPVFPADGGLPQTGPLRDYGELAWSLMNARPQDVAPWVPQDLGGESVVRLLCDWLAELAGEGLGAGTGTDLLGEATYEAILNVLVVLSERKPHVFLVACRPERLQPLLSRAVLSVYSTQSEAAMLLLGRLRFVDLSSDPGVMEVLDYALRAEERIRRGAFRFLRSVRQVRGDSIAERITERIRSSRNEAVAQGFTALAEIHLRSATCTGQDRLLIRQTLQTRARQRYSGFRPVEIAGSGSAQDPLRLSRGPDRLSGLGALLGHHEEY